MAGTSNPKPTARQTSRKSRHRILRVILAMSLWHAPIPWVHVHDLEGPQVDHRQSLAQHVAEFHSRDLAWGHSQLDWHAHLVLPWSLNHHLPCPDRDHHEPASDDFVAVKLQGAGISLTKAIGEPTSRAFVADVVAAHAQGAISVQPGAIAQILAGSPGSHFFETYGRSSAIRDLAGVRLC
jgi:hypothetical protein